MAKKDPALPLRSKVTSAMRQAYVALYAQLGHHRPAWGTEASAPLDAWTSAQVLDLELPDSLDLTGRRASGMAWLESKQNANGSWTGQLFRKANGDVPATAHALLAMHDFGDGFSASTLSAYDWLTHTCDNGWMAAPVTPRPPDAESRHYSTAYAVRALLRAPRNTATSMAVHEGLESLLANRTPDGVWGYSRHGSSDVTFTCAVLHAFVEARELWGISYDGLDLERAATWLAGQRLESGYWRDWQGIEHSPEATAYALLVLGKLDGLGGAEMRQSLLSLLALQHDGLWTLDDGGGGTWVTASVVACLAALGYGDVDVRTVSRERRPDESVALYTNPTVVDLHDIPRTRVLDHTMHRALEDYVARRIPDEELTDVMAGEGFVDIHGIYPGHAYAALRDHGYRSLRRLADPARTKAKPFNSVRPEYWLCKDAKNRRGLVLAVTPGEDYIRHYGAILRHAMWNRSVHGEEMLTIQRYPKAEQSIAGWTHLPADVLADGGIVTLGYVEPLVDGAKEAGLSTKRVFDNKYYSLFQVSVKRQPLFQVLGAKYSYWGSISYHLTSALYAAGVREVVYFGKLGTMTSDDDMYSRVFSPSRFGLMRHDSLELSIDLETPPLLRRFPDLDTGLHVSVPTVLEEDYLQRRAATDLGAASLDNEIAHMARAASVYGGDFSAAHFATDYIRTPGERNAPTSHDLASNRGALEANRKRAVQQQIVRHVLLPYLTGS